MHLVIYDIIWVYYDKIKSMILNISILNIQWVLCGNGNSNHCFVYFICDWIDLPLYVALIQFESGALLVGNDE